MTTGLILGFFDGVHLAHRTVIQSALEFCSDAVLVTFKHSPVEYFNKKCEYIFERQKSLSIIKSLGVSEVVELDFPTIVDIEAESYIKSLVEKYRPKSISTGFNHTFGKNRMGNPDLLKKMSERENFKYFCIPPQMYNGEVISSTLIKQYLTTGDVVTANKLLGTNFSIRGVVVHGAKIGRTIGFPTANISYPNNIVQIPFGVYSVSVNGKPGMLNWGVKPTVSNVFEPVAETHIFNFNEDLYGQEIEVEILRKIRDEKKFYSIEELKMQILKDAKLCLKF